MSGQLMCGIIRECWLPFSLLWPHHRGKLTLTLVELEPFDEQIEVDESCFGVDEEEVLKHLV
jgi:hypothetical protein